MNKTLNRWQRFRGTSGMGVSQGFRFFSQAFPPLASPFSNLRLSVPMATIILSVVLLGRTATLADSPPIPVPSGLVAWWAGDGNARDLVGSNHGVLRNGATFTEGKVGRAFWFDGVDDWVQAATIGLPTGSSDRTIEFWAKIDALPVQNLEAYFAGYGLFGTRESTFHMGASRLGELGASLLWSSWMPAITGPDLQTQTWYHMAVTSDGGIVRLYLNGVEVQSDPKPFRTPQDSTFFIGGIPDTPWDDAIRLLRGAVDEVSVYDRALSDTEVLAIFQAGSAGKAKAKLALNVSEESGQITLSWDHSMTDLVLEKCPDLYCGNWIEVPVTTPGQYVVGNPTGTMFYRLRAE